MFIIEYRGLNMLNYTNEQLNSKELKIKVAVRIHNLRNENNLTLDYLAYRLGYSKPTVQSWEKGWEHKTGTNKIPTLEQLLDLSVFYNCTPEYILCEYDLPTKQTTDVFRETGLTPKSVSKLNGYLSAIKSPESINCILLLAFINHFIINFKAIFILIYNRISLENRRVEFEKDPYHDIILKGYDAIMRYIDVTVYDEMLETNGVLFPMLSEHMLEYLKKQKIKKDDINKIMGHFHKHCGFLVTETELFKRSDFAISNAFIDIVKSFFKDYPDNLYGSNGYYDYIDLVLFKKD